MFTRRILALAIALAAALTIAGTTAAEARQPARVHITTDGVMPAAGIILADGTRLPQARIHDAAGAVAPA